LLSVDSVGIAICVAVDDGLGIEVGLAVGVGVGIGVTAPHPAMTEMLNRRTNTIRKLRNDFITNYFIHPYQLQAAQLCLIRKVSV
jgi:hypothetical protein